MKDLFGPGKYGAFVGLAAIVLIVVVGIVGITSDSPGGEPLKGGDKLPPFVALLATAQVDCDDEPCDANVARKDNSGDAGKKAACGLEGPKYFNACTAARKGPLVLGFFVTAGGDCENDMDVLEDVRRRHPKVTFAAVGIKADRGDLRDLIRLRRWGFPVAWDRDGAVANISGVASCPQFVFVRPPDIVQATSYKKLSAAEMDRRVRALEAAAAT